MASTSAGMALAKAEAFEGTRRLGPGWAESEVWSKSHGGTLLSGYMEEA